MPKNRSPIRNRVEEIALLLAARGVGALRRKRAESLGRRLGLLFRLLSRSRRRLATENISRAFPDKSAAEVERLSRAVFAHFGGLVLDLVATIGETTESILGRVEVVGEERARAAFTSGRGLFFLTSHQGNWEMAALATSLRGMPMRAVVRPLDNPLLERHLRVLRERGGNLVVPKATAGRELFRALRAGDAVGILMDQHARPPDAVPAPFFGRPASTTTAVARLADRTEALILPSVALRTGPARYRLEFGEPIDVRTLPPAEREAAALTGRLNGILEEMIRKAPEQWLWLHNRWRLD